ncbi:hypothetical protein [Uliginosibacterium gangwonense]|uniref:hypothetical protein n=1 Tax=Uliginosibacterium gangwonense TaxID=392736 RepID=UPI001469FD2D|nr:hypothetical protein [Uliginosibacterium gangwonense]
MKQNAEGEWVSPAGCKEIYWTVDLPDIVNNDYLASTQQSIHLPKPGWSLLSEPSSLLRVKGDKSASFIKSADPSIRLIGAKKLTGDTWKIPSESSAPEFFVINTSNVNRVQLNGLDVNYISDNTDLVERLQLNDMHAKVLGALSDILKLKSKLENRRESVLVVWIGIDKRLRGINGAAGHRSFVANYIIDDDPNESINRYRAMMVIAHEQFHQLVDMTRTRNNSLPNWVSESLAQYYALHVLAKIAGSPETQRIKSEFIKPDADYKLGLLELDRKNQAGDRSLYHLFYEQGATFWQAIDETLRESKEFPDGLDSVINDLLSMDFPKNGSLPPDFIGKIRHADEKRLDDILNKYIGT